MAAVKRTMGKEARARWFLLAFTASFQRLAAYLPGLVCPYRQVGLFSMTREAYPSDLLLWLEDCCASKSALLTNFGESPTGELRRIPLPRPR